MDPEASIRRVIALYGPLLDDRRDREWGELFATDATWSAPGASFTGRDAIVEGVRAMQPPTEGLVRHLSFAPIIEVEGAELARGWTDFMVVARSDHEAAWEIAAVGRYCDAFDASDGTWRFAQRVVDMAPRERSEVDYETGPRV